MCCRVLLTLLSVASAAAVELTLSERTLRLQAGVTFELVARPGCFDWDSARDDVAEVVGEPRCDGESSTITVRTHSPPAGGGSCAFITARSRDAPDDSIFTEVNVARIAALKIATTVRRMVAHELQWLELSATDAVGNSFSRIGVDALDVAWAFAPGKLIELISPAETRQALEPSLAAAAAAGRWASHARVAALAGGVAGESIKVSASIVDGGATVRASELLAVEPSTLALAPEGRAVVAPGTRLQYALRTCGVGGRCSSPPPGKGSPAWTTEPARVASVSAGAVLALAVGETTVRVTQPLFDAHAEVRVVKPALLSIELLEPSLLPLEAPAGSPPAVLLVGTTRFVRVRVQGAPAGEPLLLPHSSDKPKAHQLPSTRAAHGAGLVTMTAVGAPECGLTCTLERCTAKGACNGGRRPHALCLCYKLHVKAAGAAGLRATLGAPPASDVPDAVSRWPALAADLPLTLLETLTLAPAARLVPWACAPGAPTPSISLPAVGGGSGTVTWSASPKAAADVDRGSGRLALRAPTPVSLTAADGAASLSTVGAYHAVEIAALRLHAPAATVALGTRLTVPLTFLDAKGHTLRFDECAALRLSVAVRPATGDGPIRTNATSLTCAASCAAAGGASCASLHVEARAVGAGTVALTFESRCKPAHPAAPITATLDLSVFALPPPHVFAQDHLAAGGRPGVRLCVGSPGSAVLLSLRGMPDALRHLPTRVASSELPDALEVGSARAEGELMLLPIRCVAPHAQSIAVAFDYAEALPPALLRLDVVCGSRLRLTSLAGARARPPLAMQVGEARDYAVSGAWAGATLRATLVTAGGADEVADDVARADVQSSADGWLLGLGGVRRGDVTLALSVAPPADAAAGSAGGADAAAASCDAAVPLTVRVGGFAIVCPSAVLLVGHSMACYALPTAAGEPVPPLDATATLDATTFAWRSGSGHLAFRPLGGARTFAVLVRALAAGSGSLIVEAAPADGGGAPVESSFAIDAIAPLPSRLSADVDFPGLPSPVPPRATVCLQDSCAAADDVRWALCDARGKPEPKTGKGAHGAAKSAEGKGAHGAAKSAEGKGAAEAVEGAAPSVASTGLMWTGGRTGPVCLHASSGWGASAQDAEVLLEVQPIAQVRLMVPSGGRGCGAPSSTAEAETEWDGTLVAGVPTVVCASAFSALGLRFLPASLPHGWAHVGAHGAGAGPASVAVSAHNGSCATLTADVATDGALLFIDATAADADILDDGRPAPAAIAARAYVPLAVAAAAASAAERRATAARGARVPVHANGSDADYAGAAGMSAALTLALAAALAALGAYSYIDVRRSTRKPAERVNPMLMADVKGPYSPRRTPTRAEPAR